MNEGKLIVFDAEGVIIPKGQFLFKTFQRYKPLKLPLLLLYGFLYLISILSIKKAIKRIFKELEGVPLRNIQEIGREIHLKPGVEYVFKTLKERGVKIALISSGIPQSILEILVSKFGLDHIIGPDMVSKDGLFTGDIVGITLDEDGKRKVLENLVEQYSYSNYNVISVADDRNNLPLFGISTSSIGYNPDFLLQFNSDHIVTGKLVNILPIILGENQYKPESMNFSTILRKTVHISAMIIPLILVDLIGKEAVIALLFLAIGLYTISETLRVLGYSFPLFTWFTLLNTTDSEASEFVDDPIFFALGLALPLMLFPRDVAFASIAVLTLGDSAAAIIGMKYGKHYLPVVKRKTIEGTISGFLIAYLGAIMFLDPRRALLAAFFGSLMEALPSPLNDNLSIPLVTGLAALIL